MNTPIAFSGANSVGDAAERAHQVVDNANAKAVPALERAATAAHRTIDKAADAAAPAAEWVSDSGKHIATKSNELMDVCASHVRARPLVTVVGALALGYLAGKLFR